MADPIVAFPIVDPQEDVNQLNQVYSSEYLSTNHNTFFNEMTANERLPYMPEVYEGQAGFNPLQTDYGLNFNDALEAEGYVNYINNNAVRTAQTAGPTVTVGGTAQPARRGTVLTPETIVTRLGGAPEERVIREGEALPSYFRGPSQTGPTESGSVFDYWQDIPYTGSLSFGQAGTFFDEGISTAPEPDPTPGPAQPIVFQLGDYMQRQAATIGGGVPGSPHAGKAGHTGTHSKGNIPDTPGLIGAIADAFGGKNGKGNADGEKYGGKIEKKEGGKIDDQMAALNYAEGDQVTVGSPDQEAGRIIKDMQAREGSNVKIIRNEDGHFLGAVDLNDTSRHYISSMDQFDTALGIIEPHEQAIASDPRQAGQLDRKRNWKNRSDILNAAYQSQFASREPESDDQRSIDLIQKQMEGQSVDQEAVEGQLVDQEAVGANQNVGRSASVSLAPAIENEIENTKRILKPVHSFRMEAMRAFDSDKMSAYEEYSRPVRPAPARQDVRPVVGGMEGGPGVRYEHKVVEYPKDQRPVVGFVPPARKDGYPSAPPEVPYRSQERDLEEEGAFDPEAYRRKQREDIDMELALKRVEESKNKTPPKDREKPFVPIENEPAVYQAKDSKPRGSSESKQPGELSPEEAGYIEFHRDNLYNNKFKRNEDGSITTIAGTIVSTKSGEAYLVPGYDPETGKVLSGQEAFDRAREIGLENFPVFRGGNAEENMERARAREIELKHIIEQDMHQWMRKHGMQAGGEVPQINKSGLIQGEGGPTTDSIPMRAEPDSFIVNAPAVEMVGKQNLDSAIHKVQKQQQQSGFNQFGNPVTGAQDINVSNGEYKVSKKDAERIGYDNLNRINDAGKPFVEQIDKRGYAEGGNISYNNPGNVENTEKWAGKTGETYGDNNRFAVFDTPEMGLRALARDIRTKIKKGGKNGTTIKTIISKYAPANENDTNNYIKFVTDEVAALYPEDKVGKSKVTMKHLPAIVKAIVKMENQKYGEEFIERYTNDNTFSTALRLAEYNLPENMSYEEALQYDMNVTGKSASSTPKPAPEYLSNRGFVEEPIPEDVDIDNSLEEDYERRSIERDVITGNLGAPRSFVQEELGRPPAR